MNKYETLQNTNGLELTEYCANGNTSGAMRLLQNIDCCNLDCKMEFAQPFVSASCKIMYTPLMFACANNMEEVCMKLLSCPDRCGLHHKTMFNVSALSLANNQGLAAVSARIIQCKRDLGKK